MDGFGLGRPSRGMGKGKDSLRVGAIYTRFQLEGGIYLEPLFVAS